VQRYTFFYKLRRNFVIIAPFRYFYAVFFNYPTLFLYFCSVIMDAKRKIVFIINPISGTHSKDEIPQLIESGLDKSLYDGVIKFTEYAGHAAEIALQCVKDGVDVVAAVGGDGTVNEVARSLIHTDTALAIIPCGSGNGLARHLCIPLEPKKAIQIINACNIEKLDYGVINDLPFFCTCGMGFDAFISFKFAEAGKRGPITYVENVLKEGLKYKPETYEVEDETGAKKYKAFLIACANASQYGNNAYIAPKATMTDGLMDVIVMEPFNAFDAPQISIDLFNKTLDNNSKIKTFKAKRIHVHRSAPGAIHYDGDPIMTGMDVDVSIEKHGIKIVTNPDVKEDNGQPNFLLNAFSDFFNNINNVREDIGKQSRHIQAINKVLLRKLTR
jgi:YegS/Rv2252/BmrU family lipid kinase